MSQQRLDAQEISTLRTRISLHPHPPPLTLFLNRNDCNFQMCFFLSHSKASRKNKKGVKTKKKDFPSSFLVFLSYSSIYTFSGTTGAIRLMNHVISWGTTSKQKSVTNRQTNASSHLDTQRP